MVRIGNFLFHYRNGLFPLAFMLLLWKSRPLFENDLIAAGVGFGVAMAGQAAGVGQPVQVHGDVGGRVGIAVDAAPEGTVRIVKLYE
jgi:hypothetical protein